LNLSARFQPVPDAQAVYRLTDAELAPSPAETLNTKHAISAGLAFPDAGVAALIPGVAGVTFGGAWGLLPSATPLIRKLDCGVERNP
jgi:hypothetical protein